MKPSRFSRTPDWTPSDLGDADPIARAQLVARRTRHAPGHVGPGDLSACPATYREPPPRETEETRPRVWTAWRRGDPETRVGITAVTREVAREAAAKLFQCGPDDVRVV